MQSALNDVKQELLASTPAPAARGGARAIAPAAEPGTALEIKLENDGGWPADYQPVRARAFDQGDYDRLRAFFFTMVDVIAGSRESRTRNGTLRATERVTRQKLRIEEWPVLQQNVEQLHGAGRFSEALAHLRCLEKYMQSVDQTVPRILRGEATAEVRINLGASAEAVEMTDMTTSPRERRPAAINVEDQPARLSAVSASVSEVRVKAEPESAEEDVFGVIPGTWEGSAEDADDTEPVDDAEGPAAAAAAARSSVQGYDFAAEEWPVGALVWAKMSTFPYWPAEVVNLETVPEAVRAALRKRRGAQVLVEVRNTALHGKFPI